MRSYVVKRFSHFRHSRRRRMESASLLSRESTTLSLAKPQNGHFMVMKERLIVAGGNEHSAFSWGELAGCSPLFRTVVGLTAECRMPTPILPLALPAHDSPSTVRGSTADHGAPEPVRAGSRS